MTRLSMRHILTVTATWGVVSATQQPFTAPTAKLRRTDSLLSAPFLSFVDEIRQNGSIPGISIGVVRLGEDKEPSRRRDGGQRARKEIGMAWSYVYVPTSVQLTYCSEWRDDPDTL